jgi:AcrR family transcriptional regulator
MPRPLQAILSPEIITDAALTIYGRTGDFTMADLAQALKVRQSSLYNHVSGKPEIIERIRHVLHEEMAIRVDVNADWRQVIRDIATAHRAIFARHPWAIPMIATSPAELGSAITTIENFATVLVRAGFAHADVLMILGTVDILAIGGGLDLVSPTDLYPRSVLDGPSDLARAVRSAPAGANRADAAFGFSLDLLIAALQALLAQPGRRPTRSRRTHP